MNKEEINSDKKLLASLEAEYKRAQRVIYSIRALVTDINFEELIPDSQERCLMVDELQAYDYIRTNLMNRIRFYRARIKRNEGIKDWSQYKRTDDTRIGVDVSVDDDRDVRCSVCGDGIDTVSVQDPNESQPVDLPAHHCGQDAVEFKQLTDDITDAYKDYCRGVFEQFLSRKITWAKFVEKVALPFCRENINEFVNTDEPHHCGQDADDACCQARHFNMDGYRQVIIHEGNIPADQEGSFSLKDLLGMQVVGIGKGKCEGCPADHYGEKCVKIEAVGGIYICLAPLPNSIVSE